MIAAQSKPLPPGNIGLSSIGETLAFISDINGFIENRHSQYGPIFKARLLGQPIIFVQGAEANRFILTQENQSIAMDGPPNTKALIGPRSLSVQTGELHKQRRKLLAQAFQPRALEGYIPTIGSISDRYFERWCQAGSLSWYPELRKYTFDIACKFLVGLDHAAETDLCRWFEVWSDGLFALPPLRLPGTQFDRAYRCRRKLLSGIEQLIRQRQQLPHSGQDALGILLLQAEDEAGYPLSLAELKDQLLMLLFAGHGTLTSALSSFCLLLAQHPEVKAKARREQAQFQPAELSLESLKQMTYLDSVLKEVLRLIAPVGGGFRKVAKTCELGDYTLPKGWRVVYSINLTHQDSEIFSNPAQFDPERFCDRKNQEPFSYLPFGGGVRECLGKEFARLEMKLFAIKLLRQYDWELLPNQNLQMALIPTPRPKDGLQVHIWKIE